MTWAKKIRAESTIRIFLLFCMTMSHLRVLTVARITQQYLHVFLIFYQSFSVLKPLGEPYYWHFELKQH